MAESKKSSNVVEFGFQSGCSSRMKCRLVIALPSETALPTKYMYVTTNKTPQPRVHFQNPEYIYNLTAQTEEISKETWNSVREHEASHSRTYGEATITPHTD